MKKFTVLFMIAALFGMSAIGTTAQKSDGKQQTFHITVNVKDGVGDAADFKKGLEKSLEETYGQKVAATASDESIDLTFTFGRDDADDDNDGTADAQDTDDLGDGIDDSKEKIDMIDMDTEGDVTKGLENEDKAVGMYVYVTCEKDPGHILVLTTDADTLEAKESALYTPAGGGIFRNTAFPAVGQAGPAMPYITSGPVFDMMAGKSMSMSPFYRGK